MTLTAAAEGYAATTYLVLDANTVTFILDPYFPNAQPAPATSTVTGMVTNWQAAGFPGGTAGRFKRVALVVPSEPEPGVTGVHPGTQSVVAEEACDVTRDGLNNPLPSMFTLTVETGRRMALMANVFFYDSVDGTCDPETDPDEALVEVAGAAVGLLGPVTVGPGTNPNQVLALNYPASLDHVAVLSGAPATPGLVYSANAMVDLGTMGCFTFNAYPVTQPTVEFNSAFPAMGLVAIPSQLAALTTLAAGLPLTGGVPPYLFQGAVGPPEQDQFGNVVAIGTPFSQVFQPFVTGTLATLTPWFVLPQVLSPTPGGTLVNRRFSWASLGRSDGVVRVDVAAADGGLAFPRWTVLAPGGTTQVTLPQLDGSGLTTDLSTGENYVWQIQAVAFRDDAAWSYQDHTLEPLQHINRWAAHASSQEVPFGL